MSIREHTDTRERHISIALLHYRKEEAEQCLWTMPQTHLYHISTDTSLSRFCTSESLKKKRQHTSAYVSMRDIPQFRRVLPHFQGRHISRGCVYVEHLQTPPYHTSAYVSIRQQRLRLCATPRATRNVYVDIYTYIYEYEGMHM